jgi:hypothetical protein
VVLLLDAAAWLELLAATLALLLVADCVLLLLWAELAAFLAEALFFFDVTWVDVALSALFVELALCCPQLVNNSNVAPNITLENTFFRFKILPPNYLIKIAFCNLSLQWFQCFVNVFIISSQKKFNSLRIAPGQL